MRSLALLILALPGLLLPGAAHAAGDGTEGGSSCGCGVHEAPAPPAADTCCDPSASEPRCGEGPGPAWDGACCCRPLPAEPSSPAPEPRRLPVGLQQPIPVPDPGGEAAFVPPHQEAGPSTPGRRVTPPPGARPLTVRYCVFRI